MIKILKLFLFIAPLIAISLGISYFVGLTNSGCGPSLHLIEVEPSHNLVMNGKIVSVNETVLNDYPELKDSLEQFIASNTTFLAKEISISEQGKLLDTFNALSLDSTFDYVLMYRDRYLFFGIVNC
ncbi:MAG: hypothetical protein ACXAC7_18985 [Candidatus Hodarchaeales archaeon]|jgi:hypothetical protein